MDIAIFPALIKLPRKVYRHHITKVFAIKSRLLLDILIHEFGIVHLRIMLERVLPVKRECAVTYMVSTGKICGSTLCLYMKSILESVSITSNTELSNSFCAPISAPPNE